MREDKKQSKKVEHKETNIPGATVPNVGDNQCKMNLLRFLNVSRNLKNRTIIFAKTCRVKVEE